MCVCFFFFLSALIDSFLFVLINNSLSGEGGLGEQLWWSLKIHCLRERMTSQAWQDCRPLSQWAQLMLPMAPNNNIEECSKWESRFRENQIFSTGPERGRERALYGFRPNWLPYYEWFTAAFWEASSCGSLQRVELDYPRGREPQVASVTNYCIVCHFLLKAYRIKLR